LIILRDLDFKIVGEMNLTWLQRWSV